MSTGRADTRESLGVVDLDHAVNEILPRRCGRIERHGLGREPSRNIQTTLIPPGGAAIVEFRVEVPGRYLLVDHSLFRALEKGAVGSLEVTGPDAPEIFRALTPR